MEVIINGVHDIVSGEKPMPGEKAENQNARKQWVKENAKAMVLISTSIGESQLECLLNCLTAQQMWSQLSSIHEQKTASNKLVLMVEIYKVKHSGGCAVVRK